MDVLTISLGDAIRRYECRSLDVGALAERRAHEALDAAAGDGCELLVYRVTSVLWRRPHARGSNHGAQARHWYLSFHEHMKAACKSVKSHLEMFALNKGMPYAP
jgi:hypothetical protein